MKEMFFKKTVLTGALALSVVVGAGSAFAATPTTGTINPDQLVNRLQQQYGLSLSDLLQKLQGANLRIVCPEIHYVYPGQGGSGNDHGQAPTTPGTGSENPDNGSAAPDEGQAPAETPDTDTPAPGTEAPVTTPAPGNGQTEAPTAPSKPATDTASAYADQVVSLVNAERAKAGLSPLTSDPALANMALDKAKDMYNLNYFDHNSPTYGSPFDMMKKYGIQYSYAGENIAKGQRDPQEVMNAWMNSAGHRQNILSPNYTKIGVAFYNGEWVQEFIAN
ncbi:CAP domain-containing protein [Paenibacillus filicis]|uniref:CAP domain-containing protein n=1 Tax=Paenibacillus filicis TaxID=669464 RepID=A0ABU9DRX5_9BACL